MSDKTEYTEGEYYYDIHGPGMGAHLTHGGVQYHGMQSGCHAWRCSGCGETVFLRAGPGETAMELPEESR